MKKLTIAIAFAASTLAAPAHAMTVRDFLAGVANIPRNPSALLRADTRRLLNEVRGGFAAVRAEQTAARQAGVRPASCIPENVTMSSGQLLARLNAVPEARRNISVTQALREWAAERHPCPG